MKTLHKIRFPILILIICLLAGSMVLLPGTCRVCEQMTGSNGLDYPGISLVDSTDIEEEVILSKKSGFPPKIMLMAGSVTSGPSISLLYFSPQTPPPEHH